MPIWAFVFMTMLASQPTTPPIIKEIIQPMCTLCTLSSNQLSGHAENVVQRIAVAIHVEHRSQSRRAASASGLTAEQAAQ
jgi:hypothetical protein